MRNVDRNLLGVFRLRAHRSGGYRFSPGAPLNMTVNRGFEILYDCTWSRGAPLNMAVSRGFEILHDCPWSHGAPLNMTVSRGFEILYDCPWSRGAPLNMTEGGNMARRCYTETLLFPLAACRAVPHNLEF